MKTIAVILMGLMSVTFTLDAEAAKKSKLKQHRKHHAALKHQAVKKKLAQKILQQRKPAQVEAKAEKVAAIAKPKHAEIVVNMTEQVSMAEQRTVTVDPNRPLTW